MGELTIWTSREMNRLRRDVDRLLERLWVCFAGGTELPGDMKGPYFEIRDEGDNLVVIAELPGASADDVDIWVRNDMLHIEYKRRSVVEHIGAFHRRVRESFHTITKTIRLPSKIRADKVTADYVNGVFRIVLPKLPQVQSKPVRIVVK